MPVQTCTKDGQGGYKWGPSGTCFTGPGSRAKAAAQGRAIEARRRMSKLRNLFGRSNGTDEQKERQMEQADLHKSAFVETVPIVKTERRTGADGQRQNLVFGWANVPHPVAKADLAPEGSVEAQLKPIHESFLAEHPDDREAGTFWTVVATKAEDLSAGGGSLLVSQFKDGAQTFFSVSFMRSGESFMFAPPVEQDVNFVDKSYVAKAETVFAALLKGEVPKTDLQGDRIPIVELEKAAYEFVLKSREADTEHDQEVIGQLVESFVITDEKLAAMGVPADVATETAKGWWVGFKVDDATMDRVEKGELAMFSIGGQSIRTPVAA